MNHPERPEPTRRRVTIGTGWGHSIPDPHGRTVELRDGVDGIRDLVETLESATGRCAWWNGSRFQESHRLREKWLDGSVLALDLDTDAHDPLDPGTAHALTVAARTGALPGHLFHLTRAGARLVALLPDPVEDLERFELALRGFAAEAQEALDALGLLAEPGSSATSDRVRIDELPAVQAMFGPRAFVKGEQRAADVVVIRTADVDVERLVDAAPLFRTREQVAEPIRRPRAKPVRADLDGAEGAVAEAALAFGRDHPVDFTSRTCPTCGHRDCFGPLDGNLERWSCFSSNHQRDSGGCGAEIPGRPGTGWGDSLTIEAHRQHVGGPVALLRQGGYLVEGRAVVRPAESVPVRSFEEVHEEVREAVRSGLRSERSRVVVAPPGAGKTSAALVEAVDLLRANGRGVVVLALPTRGDVDDKVGKARELVRFGSDGRELLVPDIAVETLLGASSDPDSGSWCSRFEDRRARADLFRFGCRGCPDIGACRVQSGRHLRTLSLALGAAENAEEVPALVVGTLSAVLAHLDSLPADARVVLDDAGWAHGLVEDVDVDSSELASVRDRLLRDIEDHAVPIEAAGLAVKLADWSLRAGQPEELEGLSVDPGASVGDLLEIDGEVGLAWGSVAARLLRSAAAGMLPRASIRGDRVGLSIGNPELRSRARAGRVLWLSVGSVPAVAEAVGAELVEVRARAERLRVVACSDRNWGAGKPGTAEAATRAEQVRTLAQAIRDDAEAFGEIRWKGDAYGPAVGAVLRKATKRALGDPEWVESYGAGHAAHDRLAGCDVLVVARFASAPVDMESRARRMGSALGIDPDRLAHELASFEQAHNIENAIGRLRPLTANRPQLVVLLDRPPIDAPFHVDERVGLPELLVGLGLPVEEVYLRRDRDALDSINEERRAAADELDQAVADAVEADPFATDRQIADRLGVSRRAVRDRDTLGATGLLDTYSRGAQTVPIVSPSELADEMVASLGEVRASALKAARRALDRLSEVLAADDPDEAFRRLRKDVQRRLAAVLEALERIVDRSERALVEAIEEAAEAIVDRDPAPVLHVLELAAAGGYGSHAASLPWVPEMRRAYRGAG